MRSGSRRCVLLTLQASFLLPPFGYALMMARGVLGSRVPPLTFARALAPFLVAQVLVLGLTLGFSAAGALAGVGEHAIAQFGRQPLTKDELEKRLQGMMPQPFPAGLPPLGPPPSLSSPPAK